MIKSRVSYSKDTSGWRVIYDKLRPDGTVFRTQKRGFAKKQDAKDWYKEYEKKLSQGVDVDNEQMLLSDWLDRWYNIYAVKKSGNTKASYKNNIEHIKKALGNRKLCDLRKDHVQQFYNEFAMMPNGRGGLMSQAMLQRVHTTLNSALKSAVEQGLIMRNPCSGTDRGEAEKTMRLYCTSKQLVRFLELASKSELYLPLLLCSLMGLRRGEALGIKWDAINEDRVEIRGQLTQDNLNGGIIYKDKLKTSKSWRELKIPPEIIPELKKQRKNQIKAKLLAGEAYHDTGLVCTQANGDYIPPSDLSAEAKKLLNAAGIDPRIHLHDLRHSYATLLRQAGVAIETISELLGHSDVKTTYGFYIGSDAKAADDAADQIGSIIGLSQKNKLEPNLSQKGKKAK